MTSWLDLRPLVDTSIYHNAVEAFHTPEKPWYCLLQAELNSVFPNLQFYFDFHVLPFLICHW